jgi:hypothetical protein
MNPNIPTVSLRVNQASTVAGPTGIGPQRQPGIFSASAPMAGYPKLFNIEMDPHEDLIVAGGFLWALGSALKVVEEYEETLKKYPNPRGANLTRFLWSTAQR